MSLSTLIVGIVCMVVGWYLRGKSTDKKWIEKEEKCDHEWILSGTGFTVCKKCGVIS